MIGRGIERSDVFKDDVDRDDFVDRLAQLAVDRAWLVYAWALMPNHFHLLVRTGERPLERSMRSLLSGYATRFNRRHQRAGHLFQNRYRSTLCDDDAYFSTLVRYIHRNPIPVVVTDEEALARYPYTGHSTLLGARRRSWQATADVLRRFGSIRGEAIRRYEAFVRSGDSREDLEGGGLRRSRDSWSELDVASAARERFGSDERILGSRPFVRRILKEVSRPAARDYTLSAVIDRVCRTLGVDPRAIAGRGRRPSTSRAREGVAYLWTVTLGNSQRELAHHLGLAESSVHNAAKRAAGKSRQWEALISEPASELGNPT